MNLYVKKRWLPLKESSRAHGLDLLIIIDIGKHLIGLTYGEDSNMWGQYNYEFYNEQSIIKTNNSSAVYVWWCWTYHLNFIIAD